MWKWWRLMVTSQMFKICHINDRTAYTKTRHHFSWKEKSSSKSVDLSLQLYTLLCQFVHWSIDHAFWAAALKGSMTYALTHMGNFLLLFLLSSFYLRSAEKMRVSGIWSCSFFFKRKRTTKDCSQYNSAMTIFLRCKGTRWAGQRRNEQRDVLNVVKFPFQIVPLLWSHWTRVKLILWPGFAPAMMRVPFAIFLKYRVFT